MACRLYDWSAANHSQFQNEIRSVSYGMSQTTLPNGDGAGDIHNRSKAGSIRSQMSYSSLPYGARVHRASWSSHDLGEHYSPGRRRTSGHGRSSTPDVINRSMSRTPISALNTSIPDSLDSRTMAVSPIEYGRTASPISRPLSGFSVKSPMSRPQLESLYSEDEVPSLSQTSSAREAAIPGTSK